MREYDVKEPWIKKFNIGSNVPKGPQEDVNQFVRFSKTILKGEILLEILKALCFGEIPKWFRAFVHEGSLNWIDTFIEA